MGQLYKVDFSRIGEENPSNTIAEQNERIAQYLKSVGAAYPKSIVTAREQQKPQKDLTDWYRMGWLEI